MPTIADKTPMSLKDFLALPDDGIDRDLINGVVRVWTRPEEDPLTRRNRFHSRAISRLAYLIEGWLDQKSSPAGAVFCGEVGCILDANSNGVGVDVVYLSPERLAAQNDETTMIKGPPTLAAEVLSPSNTQDEIDSKVGSYLGAGVPVVWVVNPRFRTVTEYRPDQPPRLFNDQQILTAEPHLPGFRGAVSDIFR